MDSKSYTKKLSSKWTIQTTRAEDGTNFRYALYRNSSTPMRRCIIYLNGRTEWIEKNMELPDLLNLPADCGYLTWDLRGQGASGGERSWIDSYDTYVNDAQMIIQEALTSPIPYVLLSHSTGGLIGMYGMLKGVFKPFAYAASSPLFGLRDDPLPRYLARPLAKILARTPLSKVSTGAGTYDKTHFANNRLTHDHHMFMVTCHSPYRVPSARFGWVNATFNAIEFIQDPAHIEKLSAPTLILLGSEESIVDPHGMSVWTETAQRVAQVDTRLDVIHGARHELFSETPSLRDQAISRCRSWFKTFLD